MIALVPQVPLKTGSSDGFPTAETLTGTSPDAVVDAQRRDEVIDEAASSLPPAEAFTGTSADSVVDAKRRDEVIKDVVGTLLWLNHRALITVENHKKLNSQLLALLRRRGVLVRPLDDPRDTSEAIELALRKLPKDILSIETAQKVRMAILKSRLIGPDETKTQRKMPSIQRL